MGAATYFPYHVLVLVWHRIASSYYFRPAIPALAAALALLLTKIKLPRVARAAYLACLPFRHVP